MQNRKNCAIGNRIQELVGLPRGCQRAGLCFAVAYGDSSNQIRIVVYCAKCVRDGVTQLAALIDGTRGLRSNMACDAAWEGELLEQALHALQVLAYVRVNFAVGAFQIGVCNKEVAAMSRTGQQNHVQIIPLDYTVQVYIYKVLARYSTPVSYNLLLNLLHCQRLAQQRVVQQVQLAGSQIVGCTPIRIHLAQQFVCQRSFFFADRLHVFAHESDSFRFV